MGVKQGDRVVVAARGADPLDERLVGRHGSVTRVPAQKFNAWSFVNVIFDGDDVIIPCLVRTLRVLSPVDALAELA